MSRYFISLCLTLITFAVNAQPLTLAGANYTEQELLMEITSQHLKSKGLDVQIHEPMLNKNVYRSLKHNRTDISWLYTGTSLRVFNNVNESLPPRETYERVKELDGHKGIIWMEPTQANNTYALAMLPERAKQLGITKLSDLATALREQPRLKAAMNTTFFAQKDGLKPLSKAYDFKLLPHSIKMMEEPEVYDALKNKSADIGVIFTTDGRLSVEPLTILEDDKGFFPHYAPTPVVTKKALSQTPELREHLNALSAAIDTDVLIRLNAEVDIHGKQINTVASEFLQSLNL